MAGEVTITISGTKQVIGKLRKLRAEFFEEFANAVNATALGIDRGAKQRVVVDTGLLRRSIAPRFFREEKGVAAATVTARANYAAFVEFGTSRTGAATNKQTLPDSYRHGTRHKMIPEGALAGWVRRVVKPAGDEFDSAEFGVRFAVASRPGLPARPFLGPALEAERPKFLKRIRQAYARAVRG